MSDAVTVPLAFVDCETTGLDPDYHEVWEVALILDPPVDLSTEEYVPEPTEDDAYVWQMDVGLGAADPVALTVGRYYERFKGDDTFPTELFASVFAQLTHGAHLVGAVPSFDDAFLKRLLRRNDACPGWHYHLVDVEALAAGRLGWAPPWNSEELSKAVGVDAADFDRHTALGDARWARAIYEAVVHGKTTHNEETT